MPTTIEKPRKDERRIFRCTLCGQTGEPLVRETREFSWVAFLAWLVLGVGVGAVIYLIGYGFGILGRRERKYICGTCRNAGCLVPPSTNDVGYYTEPETKKCPECAETVKREARVCRFCGYRFEPPEQAEAGLKDITAKAAEMPSGKPVPVPLVLGRKPVWWDQTWVRILFALIVVVVLLNVADHIFSPKSAAKVPYVLPKEFTLQAEAARGAQGEAYISGRTNFPDGMKMWVEVEAGKLPLGAPNVIAGDENVVVRNGRFRTTGLLEEYRNPSLTPEMVKLLGRASPSTLKSLKLLRRPLSAGRYKVHFTAYFNGAWQTAAVLSALGGQGGENLHGKLLRQTDPDVVDSPKVLDYVATIAFPPLSQRAKAISLVKNAVLTVPGKGRSALNVASDVIVFSEMKFREAKGWSATAGGRTLYRVSYDYFQPGGQREEQAIWSVDLSTGKVRYVNENAKIFSWTPSP